MTTTPNQDLYWNSPGALRTSDQLPAFQCWALATTQTTGRLGFFRDGLLDIFPVNYFVLDDHVYFRTSADGTIATSSLDHAAFQIDHVSTDSSDGWTILLNGPVTRVKDSALLTILWGKVVNEAWSPGQHELFFSLVPTHVRGRRVGTAH
ncbi:pyridoxamine 5'-phosphate oxidase family protein [Arthrobacter agilis]|uniref:pyridoxamine 5'-phosphate oxidase family protein n=1 Tax=Arthrobacter agilis TaxID=37921 RepID=UPI0027841724|nr:pyridoxamine 5'-phosphate oxidase family protein [Arthrobacter agilis]MDQ0734761.1 hypothetical protein [Arthrobacter agilis]